MDVAKYLQKADIIRVSKLMTLGELMDHIGISYVTWLKLKKFPDNCSLKSLRKLKVFVEAWEYKNKNMSAAD